MRRSSKSLRAVVEAKAPAEMMTKDRKREVIAQFTDDVLSKLTGAFFDVCKLERWTKRDVSKISGINETAVNHILAGRRKNLTVESIALLARAMGTRPELVLHDTRPVGNQLPMTSMSVGPTLNLPFATSVANTTPTASSALTVSASPPVISPIPQWSPRHEG